MTKGIRMKPSILTEVTPHYIVDKEGKKTGVILDIKTFTTMVQELEDLHDIMQAEKLLAKGVERR